MGRLTERAGVRGDVYVPNKNAKYNPMNCVDKLGRLEDLEEQGRLIEQKHGTWIPNKHMTRTPTAENYHCSECTQTGKATAYCPNCGAKMKLKELEE